MQKELDLGFGRAPISQRGGRAEERSARDALLRSNNRSDLRFDYEATLIIIPIHAGGKGKERAAEIDGRDEGTGGTSGIVLSLEQVATGVSDVAYTLPVKVGATNQEFSLQIDTGSSDLWIASTSCYTSSCSQSKGHLYDSSEAIATGVNFSIPYLSGSAAGPIVWDSVSIGGYTVDHQALGMTLASDFDAEQLISLLYI
ncbi:acid protease [Phlegmacium glaucopus]|nr:acid protease [Phlegmacium glaucopus]